MGASGRQASPRWVVAMHQAVMQSIRKESGRRKEAAPAGPILDLDGPIEPRTRKRRVGCATVARPWRGFWSGQPLHEAFRDNETGADLECGAKEHHQPLEAAVISDE